jgi:hypothetical protein
VTLEHRDGNLYYYRSIRRGEKVRKVYVGSGELARSAHEGGTYFGGPASRQSERGRRQSLSTWKPSPHRSLSYRRQQRSLSGLI